ncbi:MAG: 2-oxoacid:acceptor oxidoreductase family protein [Deltaproteobacteria bacterium]|nr:2-oxoacid:acceptor oxidoreductase family protein [Deltaproteobacteria bacterium]
MLGIRIHGRGGQGAVVASKILAKAYFRQGLFVQAFPAFGMERRGAPVAAYVRVDVTRARARGEITNPDVCVVLDPKLLELVDVTKGLASESILILNYPVASNAPTFKAVGIQAVVNANEIALTHGLGSRLAPIVNTVILGAYAKVVRKPLLEMQNLIEAIKESVPSKQKQNAAAAYQAYELVEIQEKI